MRYNKIYSLNKIYDQKVKDYSKQIFPSLILGMIFGGIITGINKGIDMGYYLFFMILCFLPNLIFIVLSIYYSIKKNHFIKNENQLDKEILEELSKGIDGSRGTVVRTDYDCDTGQPTNYLSPIKKKPECNNDKINKLIGKKIKESDYYNIRGIHDRKIKAYKLIYLLKLYGKDMKVASIGKIDINISDFIDPGRPFPENNVDIEYKGIKIYGVFSKILTRSSSFCEWLVYYYLVDREKIKEEFSENFEGLNTKEYSYTDMLYMNIEKKYTESVYIEMKEIIRYLKDFIL